MRYHGYVLEDVIQRLNREGKIELMVRVRPHAARSRLVGVMQDGSLKMDIAAPAEDGKGNAALAAFLAGLFGVHARSVKILSGKTTRLKLVRIISDVTP